MELTQNNLQAQNLPRESLLIIQRISVQVPKSLSQPLIGQPLDQDLYSYSVILYLDIKKSYCLAIAL